MLHAGRVLVDFDDFPDWLNSSVRMVDHYAY